MQYFSGLLPFHPARTIGQGKYLDLQRLGEPSSAHGAERRRQYKALYAIDLFRLRFYATCHCAGCFAGLRVWHLAHKCGGGAPLTAQSHTFEKIGDAFLEKQRKEGKTKATLEKTSYYLKLANADFGRKPITEITAPMILMCLRKVEAKGNYETAHRLRARITDLLRVLKHLKFALNVAFFVRHEYFLHPKSGNLQEVSQESVHIYTTTHAFHRHILRF